MQISPHFHAFGRLPEPSTRQPRPSHTSPSLSRASPTFPTHRRDIPAPRRRFPRFIWPRVPPILGGSHRRGMFLSPSDSMHLSGPSEKVFPFLGSSPMHAP